MHGYNLSTLKGETKYINNVHFVVNGIQEYRHRKGEKKQNKKSLSMSSKELQDLISRKLSFS